MLRADWVGSKALMTRLAVANGMLELQGDKLTQAVAEAIVPVAKDFVPKDTHQTADSIRAEKVEPRHWVVRVDRLGNHPLVPVYLEFGTRYMAPRPFLKPAADLVIAASGLKKALRTTGGLLVRRRR